MALRTVIVRIEHTQEYALTKTYRTDEEEIARLLLLNKKDRLREINGEISKQQNLINTGQKSNGFKNYKGNEAIYKAY